METYLVMAWLVGCGARETYNPVAPDPADFGVLGVGDTGTTPTGTTPTTTTPSTDSGTTTTGSTGFQVQGFAVDGWTASGLAGELCVDGVCDYIDRDIDTTSLAVGEFVMSLTSPGYGTTHSVKTEGLNGDYSVFATTEAEVDQVYASAGVVRDPTKSTITVRHAGLSGSALPVPVNGVLVYTGITLEYDPSLTELGRGHAFVLNVDAVGLTQFDFSPCIPTYNQAVPAASQFSVNLVAGEVAIVTATCY